MDKFRISTVPIVMKRYHNEYDATFFSFEKCFIADKMREGKVWESYLHDVFEKHLSKRSVAIDAGAFIGTHTVKLSKICKKVYAFEPCLASFSLLNRNLRVNKCENVVPNSFGLSDSYGKTTFQWNKSENLGASALRGNDMNFFKARREDKAALNSVKLTTIDNLNLSELHFIKVDVEGYELKVLNGAINTIKKFKPLITCECYSTSGSTPSDYHIDKKFKFLLDLGYKYERLSHHTDLLFKFNGA